MASLGHTKYKEGTFIAIFVIGLVVAIIAGVFIPKEGIVGLIVNLVKYIAILAAIIGIIMAISHNLSVKNPVTVNAYLKAGYVLSGIVALIAVYCVFNFVSDITGEVKEITVTAGSYETNAKVIRGIGGFYYITVDTEDGDIKFPISASTYKKVSESFALKISYYSHSQVISKIESSTGSSLVDDVIDEYSENGIAGIFNSIIGAFSSEAGNDEESKDNSQEDNSNNSNNRGNRENNSEDNSGDNGENDTQDQSQDNQFFFPRW